MIKILKTLPENFIWAFSFLIFISLISARVYIEAAVLNSFFSTFVLFHHLFWFISVLLWFMISLRYIGKMKRAYLPYLSFAGILTYIPMIYKYIDKGDAVLEYIYTRDVIEAANFVFLLMYNHPKNFYMFPELLLLLLGLIVVAWFSSRSVFRVLGVVLFGFFGSMLIGFYWVGKATSKFSYIKLETAMPNHLFLSVIFYLFSLLLALILFYPEIRKKQKILFRWRKELLIAIISILFTFLAKLVLRNFSLLDYFLIFTVFGSSLFFLELSMRLKEKGAGFIAFFYAGTSLFMTFLPFLKALRN